MAACNSTRYIYKEYSQYSLSTLKVVLENTRTWRKDHDIGMSKPISPLSLLIVSQSSSNVASFPSLSHA